MKHITIDKDRMGGQPCFKGTRFPIRQFIAEMFSLGTSPYEVIDEFGLDDFKIEKAFMELVDILEEHNASVSPLTTNQMKG